jgi:pimeloyl-ACP methyl ester carboxylesterase
VIKLFSVVLVILLSVVTTVSAHEAASFEERECWFAPPLGIRVTCGYVTVPESRDPDLADDTNEIRLAVALAHSASQTPLGDPVIYLDGGPGGHSVTFGNFYLQSMRHFLHNRDVILFDQRGVGESEPRLHCPELLAISYEYLDEDLSYDEANAINLDAFASCRDQLIADGANLSRYNSAENAADVRDIVTALGYEQVNLFGASYGTRLGLTVMRDHPNRVRSAVLDSVWPPNINWDAELVSNFDHAFDRLFTACAGDAACNESFPDLEQVFYRTVDRLNETPASVGFFDQYTGVERQIAVSGNLIISALFGLMYASSEIPNLPGYIYDADQGRYDGFLDYMMLNLFTTQFIDWPMYHSVLCYEETPFNSMEDILSSLEGLPPQMESYFTGGSEAGLSAYLDFCRMWMGDLRADPIEDEPVVSDVPTLLLAGQFDPVTPPDWALLAAETLPNSFVYEYPGLGHGAFFSSTCPQRMMLDFIEYPDHEPGDECIDLMPPLRFQGAGG